MITPLPRFSEYGLPFSVEDETSEEEDEDIEELRS